MSILEFDSRVPSTTSKMASRELLHLERWKANEDDKYNIDGQAYFHYYLFYLKGKPMMNLKNS